MEEPEYAKEFRELVTKLTEKHGEPAVKVLNYANKTTRGRLSAIWFINGHNLGLYLLRNGYHLEIHGWDHNLGTNVELRTALIETRKALTVVAELIGLL